jgi:hypothetical protein
MLLAIMGPQLIPDHCINWSPSISLLRSDAILFASHENDHQNSMDSAKREGYRRRELLQLPAQGQD